jgi:hypothetical protein
MDAVQSDPDLADSLGQPHLQDMPFGFAQGFFHKRIAIPSKEIARGRVGKSAARRHEFNLSWRGDQYASGAVAISGDRLDGPDRADCASERPEARGDADPRVRFGCRPAGPLAKEKTPSKVILGGWANRRSRVTRRLHEAGGRGRPRSSPGAAAYRGTRRGGGRGGIIPDAGVTWSHEPACSPEADGPNQESKKNPTRRVATGDGLRFLPSEPLPERDQMARERASHRGQDTCCRHKKSSNTSPNGSSGRTR